MELVKIPVERIKILSGEKGETKAQIEKTCNVSLSITDDGEVEVSGDTAEVFFAKDVVKAIGRGFQPNDALKLATDTYVLFLFNLKDYFSTDKSIGRIKGRIIGEKGKMKKEIENATESVISVFGNTVSIISKIDTIEYAKDAIIKIIDGSEHSSIYAFLARARRQILGERLK